MDVNLNDKCSTLPFYEFPNFDKERYLYLKNRIMLDRSNCAAYDDLLKFLDQYINEDNYKMVKNGLIDEIYKITSELLNLLKNLI